MKTRRNTVFTCRGQRFTSVPRHTAVTLGISCAGARMLNARPGSKHARINAKPAQNLGRRVKPL
eukprot:614985-Rhodomonas_salina.2